MNSKNIHQQVATARLTVAAIARHDRTFLRASRLAAARDHLNTLELLAEVMGNEEYAECSRLAGEEVQS